MEYVVIAALAVLAAANIFFYIKLRREHQSRRANPILVIFLPFLAFMVFVLVFRWAIPAHVLLWGIAAQFVQTFFGYYHDKFERSSRFDRYMHAFGCFAYAVLLYCTLTALLEGEISRLYAAIFVGTIGLSLGVVVEILEFVADRWGKSPVRHQKGLQDTNVDMVWNVLGSAVAGVYAYLFLG